MLFFFLVQPHAEQLDSLYLLKSRNEKQYSPELINRKQEAVHAD